MKYAYGKNDVNCKNLHAYMKKIVNQGGLIKPPGSTFTNMV